MARLKRDERVCPFCGENIKAIAIRCRFCQSDVTPVTEPEPQPEIAVATEAEVAPAKSAPKAAKKTATKTPAAARSGPVEPVKTEPAVEVPSDAKGPVVPIGQRLMTVLRTNLTMVLAALVILAAAGVGGLWWSADHGSSAVSPNGALVGDAGRTEVLVTAADLTQRTLSYSYKSLANDMEVARARMTPSFRKQYVSTMTQVKANTIKNKIVLQAVAVSSAIISATEHKAKVLVFVNQTTTAGEGKKANQQLTRNSLVITLTRGEGDWAMSKLTALG